MVNALQLCWVFPEKLGAEAFSKKATVKQWHMQNTLPQVIIHERTKLTNYAKQTKGAAAASDTK